MALQGIDIQAFLEGAACCDDMTRNKRTLSNPAAIVALIWFHATKGQGAKDMVILPYKDRLQLFTRFLQQLIMESLGKEKDIAGKVVHQGISVFGNKGATDQHAYVQQLRDGLDNFFVTFIEVLLDRETASPQIEDGVTSGDYLSSFLQGTRDALAERGRESLSLTIEKLDSRSLGALIALYERAVGLYATLININAYHQPGVEAGKKMAGSVIALQRDSIAFLRAHAGRFFSADELANAMGRPDMAESIFKILQHAAANRDHGIQRSTDHHGTDSRYTCEV